MKEKLIEHLDRKLEQVRRTMNTWEDSADMAIAFYNQALGAVELAGWLVYQDNPELEQEILKMWNEEYRIKFEEIIWGSVIMRLTFLMQLWLTFSLEKK